MAIIRSNILKNISLFNCHIQTRTNGNCVPLAFYKTNNPFDETKCPILAFHGLFGNKNNLRTLMNQISLKTNQLAYSFDLRNHGESPHVNGTDSDLKAMANDVKLFMDNNNIFKADLLGHSLGGRVLSQFAFIWPDRVNKLILVDITPLKKLPKIDFIQGNPDFFDRLESAIQELPSDTNLNEARTKVKKILLNVIKNPFIADFFLLNLYNDANGKIKWRFNTEALRFLLKSRNIENIVPQQPYNGKTLIIYGEKSQYVKSDQFTEIKSLMPNVEMISIPDTGHYLHAEKPNEFIAHVVKFLTDN